MTRRILIITQKLNKEDSILGFFHRWVEEFAQNVHGVVVICLEKGSVELPSNVKVLSLGKEKSLGRVRYLFNFYKYIWQERNNYDIVFVHMNPIYIVLSGFIWRFWGKKIALWYTHKRVDWKLYFSEKISHIIFSASVESFRLPSKKLVITGHGIDVDFFCPQKREHDDLVILSIGRLSRTKNHHLLIEAMANLPKLEKSWRLLIIGGVIYPEDLNYREELFSLIKRLRLEDNILMVGEVLPTDIIKYYQEADLLVNLSDTGSLDKVVLEAMACGVGVVSSNEAFAEILGKDFFVEKDVYSLSEAIRRSLSLSRPCDYREYVVNNHNLPKLIKFLVEKLCNL